MNITIIISSLCAGGAERVISSLASYWADNCHHITIITFDSIDSDFFILSPEVCRVSIDGLKPSTSFINGGIANIHRIYKLRKEIKSSKPEVVVSFLDSTNLIASIACIALPVPLIVSERTDPTQSYIGLIRSFLRPILYRYACNFTVVQTRKVKAKCEKLWPGVKLCVIPNPLPTESPVSYTNSRNKLVISVGRLDHGKGHDTLIKAFSLISSDFPDWNMRIIGDGPSRNYLESIVLDQGLGNQIQLPGAIRKIHLEYTRAEIFCFASRFEGFPNVLLEALAMGCACIATDCESGPREILEDGRLGILTPVDDVNAMAEALRTLMGNPELRAHYASHALYVRGRYHIDKISQQWLDLFTEVKK